MPASERDVLWLSEQVYDDHAAGDAAAPGSDWIAAPSSNTPSGMYAQAFSRTTNGKTETVVVFRGTEPKDPRDAATDLQLGTSAECRQQADAAAYVAYLKQNNLLKGDVTFAGHSLGGNLAMHATIVSGVSGANCVTFNAPGFSDEYISSNSPAYQNAKGQITEFQNSRDYVSSVGHHPGEVVITAEKEGAGWPYHDLNTIDTEGDRIKRSPINVKLDPGCLVVAGVSQIVDKVGSDGSPVDFLTHVILYSIHSGNVGLLLASIVALGMVTSILIVGLVYALIIVVAVAVLREVVGFLVNGIEWLMQVVVSEAKKLLKSIVEAGIAAGTWLVNTVTGLVSAAGRLIEDTCKQIGNWLKNAWEWLTGAGRGIQESLTVNTDRLWSAAARLQPIQGRILNVDARLGRLLTLMDPADVQNWSSIVSVGARMGVGFGVANCASYLRTAAQRLDSCESTIQNSAFRFK